MKKGDKVLILDKTRGAKFKNESFQEHLQDCEFQGGYIYDIVDQVVDVQLYTKSYGKQSWEFNKKDLKLFAESETTPLYEIY